MSSLKQKGQSSITVSLTCQSKLLATCGLGLFWMKSCEVDSAVGRQPLGGRRISPRRIFDVPDPVPAQGAVKAPGAELI